MSTRRQHPPGLRTDEKSAPRSRTRYQLARGRPSVQHSLPPPRSDGSSSSLARRARSAAPASRSAQESAWRSPSRSKPPDLEPHRGARPRARVAPRGPRRPCSNRRCLVPLRRESPSPRPPFSSLECPHSLSPENATTRAGSGRCDRPLRLTDLPERSAVRLEGRLGARAVVQSGRLVGPPLGVSTHKSGGFYRQPRPRERLSTDGPSAPVGRDPHPPDKAPDAPLSTPRKRGFTATTCAARQRL